MKFSSVIYSAILASSAMARDVVCMVGDEPVGTVDLETESCSFPLPAGYPVNWDFESAEDYEATFYYSLVAGAKYFTDIINEGTVIEIAANLIYGGDSVPLFRVDDEQTPASNSTAALRRRLLGKTVYARDEESDLVAALQQLDGVLVPGIEFSVVDPAVASSVAGDDGVTATGDSTSTETDFHTTVMTITSCSDNACQETEVPAVETLTTVTVEGEVTSYTTVCPLSDVETKTELVTTTVTVTACENNKCSVTEIPAVETLTTVTVEGEVTAYTTYCPISELEEKKKTDSYDTTSTKYVTSYVTLAGSSVVSSVEAVETVVTTTVNGVETVYTTVCPVEDKTASPAPTSAPATEAETSPAVVPITNSTTLAAVPVTSANTTTLAPGAASIVCTGEECDITSTLAVTLTISTSAEAVPTIEASAVEGSANSVSGFTSVVAVMLAAVAWLI